MRRDENGKIAIGKASRPSTGKDRDTNRAGGNYGVSDVMKQETCCLPMYAFIELDEILRRTPTAIHPRPPVLQSTLVAQSRKRSTALA